MHEILFDISSVPGLEDAIKAVNSIPEIDKPVRLAEAYNATKILLDTGLNLKRSSEIVSSLTSVGVSKIKEYHRLLKSGKPTIIARYLSGDISLTEATYEKSDVDVKECSICHAHKSVTEFRPRQAMCRACENKAMNNRRRIRKLAGDELKITQTEVKKSQKISENIEKQFEQKTEEIWRRNHKQESELTDDKVGVNSTKQDKSAAIKNGDPVIKELINQKLSTRSKFIKGINDEVLLATEAVDFHLESDTKIICHVWNSLSDSTKAAVRIRLRKTAIKINNLINILGEEGQK